MDTASLLWIVLVIGALGTGAALVGVLVAPRNLEGMTAAAGTASLSASLFAFGAISHAYGNVSAILYAFAFLLAAFGGGYALAATALSGLAGRHRSPRLPDVLPDPSGRTTVILLAAVESENYDPVATADILEALENEDLLEASPSIMPFMFFAQKARYRAAGGNNPAYTELRALAERLDEAMNEPSTTVTWANCSGDASLATRVIEAARRGDRDVVVVRLAIAESLLMAEAVREVDAMRPAEHGMHVVHTDPLVGAERVALMLVARINSVIDDVAAAGVVLVGHGQPETRARRDPRYDEDEATFMNRLRALLVDGGLPERAVKVAWAEWRSPDVTSTVRHLAALGCHRVVIVPAVNPLDTLGTRLDLEVSVRQARVSEGVVVVTLPAWKDDPALVEELRTQIAHAMAEVAAD